MKMVEVRMTSKGVPLPASYKAINWAAPEKTISDMLIACTDDKPRLTAVTPKIIAKGIAPSKIGNDALKPAINAVRGEG